MYDIPASAIPREVVYQWVRVSLLDEPDKANVAKAAEAGWRPVPWERHSDLFPTARTDDGGVVLMGLQLMERSAELDAADRDDIRSAEIMLNGMGCHKQMSPHADPKVEGCRRLYQNMPLRRHHRREVREEAERLCKGRFPPTLKVQVEEPRPRVVDERRVWVFEESRSVEAWRLFELDALRNILSKLGD